MDTGFIRGVRSARHLFIICSIIFCSLMSQGADLEKARQWLIANQNQDGSWGAGEKQPTDTPESFLTLYHAGNSGEFLDKAVNWTTSISPENTAGIARSLYVLSHSNGNADALRAKLLSFQNADGGFGISKGYNSGPLMSMMALRALVECGSVERTPMEKTLDYLGAMQKADGGWTLQEKDAEAGFSDIIVSGWILSTAREYQLKQSYYPTNVCLMVSKGAAFIESKQNADGSWGDPADISATAMSIISLLQTTRPEAAMTSALAWLEGRQLADGSFSGDIYQTAIAARCLNLYYNNPFPEPPDLEIAATDITSSPSNPLTSDQILITVKVRNIGGSAAQNVGVQCYDGNPASGGTAIGPELALSSIAPGSFGTVRLGVYLQAGTHEIFVKADPLQKVMEGNEENNTVSAALTVAPAQISQADLEIIADNITFNVSNPSFPNQVEISVLIENKGETVAANAIIQLFDGTTQLGNDFVLDKVFGLGTYSFKLTTILPPGTRNITVKIDPYSQIPEPNEKNNTASKEVTVANLPPAVPQNLTGNTADGTVYLSWTASTEPDIFGYNIYRNGAKITNSVLLSTEFIDSGLTNGQSYSYKFTAVDLYGSESGFSQEISLTPQSDIPAKPVVTSPATSLTPAYVSAQTCTIEGAATAGDNVEVSVNGTLRATVQAVNGLNETVATSQADWMSGSLSDLDSFLVSYWKMDENTGAVASDARGMDNGTINGATWTTGKNASGLDFDGSDDYVGISGMGSTGTSWSLSAWGKADFSDAGWHELWEGGNPRVTISVYQNKFMIYDDNYRYSSFTLSDNDWHYYTVAVSSGSISFYVDGVARGTSSGANTSVPRSDGSARIGSYWDGWSEYWKGSIDEVSIWNCALSAGQVSLLYNSGAGRFYPEWEGEMSSNGTANSNVDPISSPGDLKLVSGRLSGYNRKIFDAGSPSVWGQLSWNADTPAGTSVKFRSRSASTVEAIAGSVWSPYYAVSGSGIVSHSDRYLEIEACLESKDPNATPILHDYEIGSPGGAFSASGVPLDEGENTITAVAKRGTLESAISDLAKVYVTLNVDLAVSANDISFSPASPGAEEPVSIIANVKNNGLGTASNAKVEFFDGNPASGGIQMGDGFIIPSLGPSGTANLTLSTYLSAGTHSIYIAVDRENTVPESDEGNNIASSSVTVAPPISLPPDFEIKDSDISFSSSNPTNLDVITINASVKNIGGTKAEILKIAIFDGNPSDGGTQIGDDIVFNNLSPQLTATIGFQAMLTPGTHVIFVVADPDNNVSEINEQNNKAVKSITVVESPQSPSDLAIQNASITFSNPAPTATDLFTISAEIVNQGGISANNVLVRFYDGDPRQGGARLGGDLAFSGIAPGGHAKANLETALPAGNHRIYVSVDPSNTILESDEGNNTAFAGIEVLSAPLPDIFIDQNEITVPQGDIRSGDLVKIAVKVRNIGEGAANKVKIRLYQGPPVGGGIKVARDLELSIPPGGFVEATLGWCAAVGTHTLYIEADTDRVLPETDDYNNTAPVTLAVLPSLAIQPVTDPEIQAAIDKGVAWLKTTQGGDGSFTWGYGGSALAMLALLHAGLTEDDPVVAKGLSFIDNYSGGYEYSAYSPALVIMAYQATNNRTKYFSRVQGLTNSLISGYFEQGSWMGDPYGMFTYGDLSNSQYGYLGLYAASQWGIEVPPYVKEHGIARMTSGQNGDGGWNYNCQSYWGGSYGSMTCAGAMTLRILGLPDNDSRVQGGITWLNDHYTVTSNPGYYDSSWTYYYLYSLERTMSIPTLIEKIGEHDWYKDGAAFLLSEQQSDGKWDRSDGYGMDSIILTSFALLFLERAVPEISHSDLIVSNVGFSNSSPIQGETITITATVKNNDIRDVKNPFKVAFYDGNPDQGGQKIGADQAIASLDGQASASVSVQWAVPTSETHTIHVLADAYNEVEEIKEDNNTGTAQISVLTNRGYEITVAADKDSYAPGE
ncbi:MAG: CARDB domain-containing protein, partial [Victivallales bacterium]